MLDTLPGTAVTDGWLSDVLFFEEHGGDDAVHFLRGAIEHRPARPRFLVTGMVYIPWPESIVPSMSSNRAKGILKQLDEHKPGVLADLAKYNSSDLARLLFFAYANDLKRYVASRSSSVASQADEVAANAIATLLLKARTPAAWGGLLPTLWSWLRTVAMNSINSGQFLVRDALIDDMARAAQGESDDDYGADEFFHLTPAFYQEANDYETVERQITVQRIYRAVKEKYGHDTMLMQVLSLLPDMSVEEIARVIHVNKQTVDNIIAKIREEALAVMQGI